MEYKKVVGRQINGSWVLFKLPNGTAAYVEPSGNVGFFYSWAQALRFTMIDARGPGCVPADELQKAVEALERYDETKDGWYARVSEQRTALDSAENGSFLADLEEEHERWCRNAKTHPDGRLVWGYDP